MLNTDSDIQHTQAATASDETLGLRRRVLSGPQVLGQSVAGIGPTIGAVSLIPLVFADASNGTWFTVALATVGILAVGVCITKVAGVHFSSGALYNLVPQGLGRVAGFLTGWVTVLTMVFSGPFLITGFVQYLATFLSTTHIVTLSAGTQYGLEMVCIIGVLGMAILDIRITTDAFLIIEGISMTLICVLLVVILGKTGNIIDHKQLSLHGSSVHGTLVGLVFLMLAFGGFESATVLGLEAREPKKAMRLAVLGSVVVVGIFLTLNAYIQVLGLKHAHIDIASQSAPLSVLADHDGVTWLGDLILLGTMSSFFAAANSTLNYGPRVLFTMAHDGLVPIGLGKTLRQTGSPYRTIIVYGVVWAGILSYIYASSTNANTAFSNLGTFAGYCSTLTYLLVSVAAPVWAYRRGYGNIGIVVAGIIGAGVMGLVFYYSLVPFPKGSTADFFYLFVSIVVAAVVVALIMKRLRPNYLERVGTTQEVAETPALVEPSA
jgi:amino acid transporter